MTRSSTMILLQHMRDLLVLVVDVMLACLRAAVQLVVPSPLKSVAGEVVLITGAAQGIGRELALQMGALGAVVVCWDIDSVQNSRTAEEVIRRSGEAHAYQCDVADRQEVLATAAAVRKEVGHVSIVVNNAAILPYGSMLQLPSAEVRRAFDVNVLAHFWVLEALLPAMVLRGRGHVVAMCSMSGLAGAPDMAVYSSSKFAVRGLMESLREELRLDPRGLNIPCTCVFPFYVDTGMARDPKLRFPCLFRAVPVADATREVVRAIRTDLPELSIPVSLLWASSLTRVLPHRVFQLMMDFLRQN